MKMYAVIPDSERLDIGKNEITAVFRHKEHAEKFAIGMWGAFHIIKEVDINM